MASVREKVVQILVDSMGLLASLACIFSVYSSDREGRSSLMPIWRMINSNAWLRALDSLSRVYLDMLIVPIQVVLIRILDSNDKYSSFSLARVTCMQFVLLIVLFFALFEV